MIGELFNAMVDEVLGTDPLDATRRSGALPYLFGKAAAGLELTGATLSAFATPPTPGGP